MIKHAIEKNVNFRVLDFVSNFVLKAARVYITQVCFPKGF